MKKKLLLPFILLFFYSCSNYQKVELDNCMYDVDFSIFKGTYPEMENNKVFELLGEPDEKIYIDERDETGFDLYYNTPEGRILLHTSDVIDEVGLIEYRPKTPLYLKDIIRYDIKVTNNFIGFFCDGENKFYVCLNEKDNSIKEIGWWWK